MLRRSFSRVVRRLVSGSNQVLGVEFGSPLGISLATSQRELCLCLGVSTLHPFNEHVLIDNRSLRHHSSGGKGKETIEVTFTDEKDGSVTTVRAPVGESLLEVAHSNDIDLEGACEGSLACSTCHVIVEEEEYYNKLPEPDDDENDMLDLAFGLTDTSRLGCQVIAKPELDGMKVKIPSATRNFAVDGHVPKPH